MLHSCIYINYFGTAVCCAVLQRFRTVNMGLTCFVTVAIDVLVLQQQYYTYEYTRTTIS